MSTRKEFIGATSLFALAPAAGEAASGTSSKKTRPSPEELTFSFDQDRFNEILAKPAKHKQCFGVTKLQGGDALEGMNNTIAAYRHYLKEPAGSVQTVAVLYHGPAVAFAFSDTIWNEYVVPTMPSAPESIRKDFADIKLGHGNPFLRSTASNPEAVSVRSLLKKGSSFFVCHNAIAGFSYMVSGVVHQPIEKVHAAILAGIVPGALVVPAGVMAINACQEAKFTYIQSSL